MVNAKTVTQFKVRLNDLPTKANAYGLNKGIR